MANIYIRPLMPRAQLAERQERIKKGLLEAGVSLDEIRALQWYDRSLENQFTAMVDKNPEPQPIGDKRFVNLGINPEGPSVNADVDGVALTTMAHPKLSRAEKYRARKNA